LDLLICESAIPPSPSSPCVEDPGNDPRGETGNLRIVPGHQRKTGYRGSINHSAQSRILGLNHRQFRANFDMLRDGCEVKTELDSKRFRYRDVDVVKLKRIERRLDGVETIISGCQ